MKFVKFESTSGSVIWINPATVSAVTVSYYTNDNSNIFTIRAREPFIVVGTPEEVVGKLG